MRGKNTTLHARLVLIRHGESQWNKENRFTGWTDIDLSPQGEHECRLVAKKLRTIPFDIAYASTLMRSWRSAEIILAALGLAEKVLLVKNDALRERHYGKLQGLNKEEAALQFGAEQIRKWRRSFRARPPEGESLADTAGRVLPYFKEAVMPQLAAGKNVLIIAHGNSLRALVMHLEGMDEEMIEAFEIAAADPRSYRYYPRETFRRLKRP